MRRSPLSLCAAALLGLALAGCLGASTPIQYYTLTSLPRPLGLADGGTGAIVAVLPVALPASIDRPQIVTRTAENQLSLSEYNRWGGSLKEDIGRTLVQNLNVLLAGKPVSILPETLAAEPRYYIAVTVNRLDGRLGEAVWLNAGWTLRDQQAKRTLAIRSFVAEEGAAGPGFADMVAAQSRLVEALSREIATELERLVRVWGNQLFKGAEGIAHRSGPERMQHVANPEEIQKLLRGVADIPARQTLHALHPGLAAAVMQLREDCNFDGIELVLPTTVFDRRYGLDLDGTRVQLIYVGLCHQVGDTIVHVPKEGVVFAGDVIFPQCTPMCWTGSYEKRFHCLDLIVQLSPEVIVPGHGPLCGIEGATEMKAYLSTRRRSS